MVTGESCTDPVITPSAYTTSDAVISSESVFIVELSLACANGAQVTVHTQHRQPCRRQHTHRDDNISMLSSDLSSLFSPERHPVRWCQWETVPCDQRPGRREVPGIVVCVLMFWYISHPTACRDKTSWHQRAKSPFKLPLWYRNPHITLPFDIKEDM